MCVCERERERVREREREGWNGEPEHKEMRNEVRSLGEIVERTDD